MNEEKGILESLFDLSFSELVTTKLVKIMYIIAIGASGIFALVMVIGGFSDSVGTGFGMIIISPIVFFLNILFARIWLELIIVLFKIAENTSHLVGRGSNE